MLGSGIARAMQSPGHFLYESAIADHAIPCTKAWSSLSPVAREAWEKAATAIADAKTAVLAAVEASK